MFELRRHGGFCHPGVVAFLGFDRRDVADRLQQPASVERVDALECCESDGLPWSAIANCSGFVPYMIMCRRAIIANSTAVNMPNGAVNWLFGRVQGAVAARSV